MTTSGLHSPPADDVLEILAHPRRRQVLRHLRATGSTSVDAVLDHVVTGDEADSVARRRRVAIQLHHVHLPKLVDAGLLTHDDGRGVVELTASNEFVESLLSLVNDR